MHSCDTYGLFTVLGLLITGSFALQYCYEENENVSVSTNEELLPCVANQYYLEEIFSIVIQEGKEVFLKLNTYLRCICDPLKKDKKFITMRRHINNENLWMYSYICSRRPIHEEKLSCTEYEVCKRDFYEYHSSSRHSLKYLDHSREYCSCDLPRVCDISEEGPKMTSYRCMHSKERNELRLCGENEVYKKETYKNGSKTDTKLMCKCDTLLVYKKHVSFKRDSEDPSHWTYSYRCFETYFIEENSTCRDEGICRRDFYEEYGNDRAGEKYLESSDIYCTCKHPQVCNISIEAPSMTTYRCMDPTRTELRPCNANEKEVHMEEIFHFQTEYKQTQQKRTEYKVDTVFKCKCESQHYGFDGDEILLDNNTMVKVHYCLGNKTDFKHPIGQCKIGDPCQMETYIDYGEERLGLYTLPLLRCICKDHDKLVCSPDIIKKNYAVFKCKFRDCRPHEPCKTLMYDETGKLYDQFPKLCECHGNCVFSKNVTKPGTRIQWYKCEKLREKGIDSV